MFRMGSAAAMESYGKGLVIGNKGYDAAADLLPLEMLSVFVCVTTLIAAVGQ
jgi:hypothetical protein